MANHLDPSEPSLVDLEPVAIADTVKAVLAALVALGWVALPDATISAVATAFGAIIYVGISAWTRRKVFSPATVGKLLNQRSPPEEPA